MSALSTTTTHPQKRRVPLWDNARWIAITLVVVGHAILKLIGEADSAYTMYLFIYAFHVPVFVAVSGYFAKSGPPGALQMQRLLTDLVFPYIIFETIWTALRWILGGTLVLDYSTASWTLWFFLALLLWRIALPYLVLLRYPLTISIMISIGAGYLSNIDGTFALSRTLGLLPFFVFGWKLRQWLLTDTWLELRAGLVWRWRAGALGLFGLLYLLIGLNIETLRILQVRRFLLYDESYATFDYSEFWAGGIRLAVMLLAFALIVAFLMLIPRRTTWFTDLGAATMYIYLLHTFVLYPLRETGVLDGPQPGWVLPGMIALSVVISIVLSLPVVRRLVRPLVEPKARWLFGPTATTPTGTIVPPHRNPK
ncbi:MAG: acyltransferase family protein [Cryobacterium sp.]|uniref:acyltransferase family protein n=1 Tax=unclassified Cryobacterium TaxID=2649013 RepID=UPI001A34CD24|nr:MULTISPECIES: acyltransferase family protein [unclassified Cryobacterium]MCY7404089.1 acyltransferase family protein [Cryobacterium sp.]MEC5153196.1 fucose 4-O-acetylase-like acetyltransferase [Cryobacterium sp. CAN_C3]